MAARPIMVILPEMPNISFVSFEYKDLSNGSAIKLTRAGLNLPDKPVGAFLFAGPTGVGKTEVAKQLASNMGVLSKGGIAKRYRTTEANLHNWMKKHGLKKVNKLEAKHNMHLSEFIANIVEELQDIPFQQNDRTVWETLLYQISTRNSCDYTICETIRALIVKHLEALSVKDKVSIWKDTETGYYEPNVDSVHISSVKRQLEEELLDEVTKYAWRLAKK